MNLNIHLVVFVRYSLLNKNSHPIQTKEIKVKIPTTSDSRFDVKVVIPQSIKV